MERNYKVTVTDHDFNAAKYTAWVSGTSKAQALVKGAALIGQTKLRREQETLNLSGLLEPDITIETVDDFDLFLANQDTVDVE